MSFPFEWNPYADQPHNVAPRSERFRYHLRHAGSYFAIAGANLRRLVPGLRSYRRYMKAMHRVPVPIGPGAMSCAVSPAGSKDAEALDLLAETGVGQTLVRVPSWERGKLAVHEAFVRALRDRGFEVTLALLQRRSDVLEPGAWRAFLEEVFSRFAPLVSTFEIGHAWNRTKWGVWDHREYVRLAEPAFELAPRFGAKLAGPAVIDFEFHLYSVTLPRLPFDKVTSHLYVDRMGAPENKQFGWSAVKKLALLKAAVDVSARAGRDVWITEVNWPLSGADPYSPASGRPNVTEEEQANYLIRYYVLLLASGLVERITWWQLAAPGYGLVDNREEPWRRRPAFHAFRTLRARIEGSVFEGLGETNAPSIDASGFGHNSGAGDDVRIFRFRKDGRPFAVCWTPGPPVERAFERRVEAVIDRDGREIAGRPQKITIDGSPKYVDFSE
ncbi:hypothetical protein D4R89_00630 [bacterium]|nr:MAG: hypothetical protein D4R89_00630 [bacterium]